MAFRKIHDSFWTDPDIEELTPEQKYFYIYLITNPNVNQLGLYEFSVRRACFETGYNADTIDKLLEYFSSRGKIIISKKTREILVVKFYWHNKNNSPKVKTHTKQLLKEVKDTSLIQYIYGIDTLSQEEEDKDEGNEKDKNNSKEQDVSGVSKNTQNSDVIFEHPKSVEKVIEIANMRGIPPEEAELYYHIRETNGWCRSDKHGNQLPIKNWQSDLVSLYRQGYLKPKANRNDLPFS